MKNSVLCYLEETAVKFPDKLAISDGELSVTFSCVETGETYEK